MFKWFLRKKSVCDRYKLSYGDFNGWVATLGPSPKQVFDPKTGKEDFTEQRKVSSFLEDWQPEKTWIPQQICLHFEAGGKACHKADRIFHSKVGPFLSENAVEKMQPLLEKDGYILPLEVVNSDEKFFLWWVPIIEESFDFDRSEKFPNGRTVKRHAFDEQKLDGIIAFRAHHKNAYNPKAQGNVCVNNDFKKAWHGAGLTGIKFVLT